MPADPDILAVAERELTAFRESGRPLHLAHAARAIADLQRQLSEQRRGRPTVSRALHGRAREA